MGIGSSSRSRSVDLTTSQKTTVTIRNSWVEGREPTARPHSAQNLARPTRGLPQFVQIAMARSIWTIGQGNRPVGDSSRKLRCRVSETRARSEAVAPERKRSARDYEQALRRQELAAGRALVQALPAEGAPRPRELAAARRVLTQSLFELRRLGRDLDEQIETLRSKQGPSRPAQARGAGSGELDRFEAVRDAVEEVAERWEGRRDQLSAELDRRHPHRGQERRQSPPGPGRSQPRVARDRGEVRNRSSAAPARPERPRSPRSRRSPG